MGQDAQTAVKTMQLLHIVRRFGPVGGMERYVWELTRALAAAGHNITVVCESMQADAAPAGITVVELGTVRPRPRWLAHLRFRAGYRPGWPNTRTRIVSFTAMSARPCIMSPPSTAPLRRHQKQASLATPVATYSGQSLAGETRTVRGAGQGCCTQLPANRRSPAPLLPVHQGRSQQADHARCRQDPRQTGQRRFR